METIEKTFRYSYVFKNLGALYLIFLAIVVAIGLIGRDPVFFICIGVMVVGGVLFLTWYLTSNVSVSEPNITTKTVLGTKSLKWSDISHISSQGSSVRFHTYDGDVTPSINSRLDGYDEIFRLIYAKRPDLFDINEYNPLSRSTIGNIVTFIFGLLLIALGLYGYYRGGFLSGALIVGPVFCLNGIINLYSSPRRITLENDNLVINYLHKSVSYSVDDIASIQPGLLVFRDNRLMKISGFKQAPFVIYFVLTEWYQKYAAKPQDSSA